MLLSGLCHIRVYAPRLSVTFGFNHRRVNVVPFFMYSSCQVREHVNLKGQSNKIFNLQFFSSFEPALATDQWVKIFSNLVKNSQSYLNFKSENLTPGKSISPGYHTPAS